MASQREEILQLVRNGESLRGKDLQGANLRGADLRGADLQEAILSGATLFGVTLEGANLTGAICRRTDFQYANLRLARLSGADLSEARLLSVNATETDFTGANLDRTVLTHGNLTRARLSRATLRNAKVRSATLRSVEAAEADLSSADLSDSSLEEARLPSAVLQRARLRATVLRGADLTRADFKEADLTGADLTSATLKETSFAQSRLEGCDFGTIPPEDLESCDFAEATGREEPGEEGADAELSQGSPDGKEGEVAEPSSASELTVELAEERLSSTQMIRCLLFVEAIVKESSRILQVMAPEEPEMTDAEVCIVGGGAEPARLTLASTDRNLATIYSLLLLKKAQIDARKVTRVRTGTGYSRMGGEQESAVEKKALAECRTAMADLIPGEVLEEILRVVRDGLHTKYGGPLVPLLRRMRLQLSGGQTFTYRSKEDRQVSDLFLMMR